MSLAILLGCALPLCAQEEKGWGFSGRFSGSANSSNTVLKFDPSISYTFNKYFQTYAGLPAYFVRDVGSPTMSGIGNAYAGIRFSVRGDALHYLLYLDVTAPTGDRDRGFSTGRVTADWTNILSRSVGRVTPFGSAGIANTISDTSFFVRPFTSLGLVGHFEGGATADVSDVFRVGASAYAVRASGQQRFFSKVVEPERVSSAPSGRGQGRGRNRVFETAPETVTTEEAANDHGFSAWFGISPRPELDFHVGYNRSVNYDFNSLFFGVGFRIGK